MTSARRVAPHWLLRGDPRAALAVALVLTAYVAWLLVGPHHYVAGRDDWLYCVAEGAGAAYAVGCAVTARRYRLAALAVAVALVLTTLGDVISDAWIHDSRPPGIPDLLWLGMYPALYLGLVARTGKRLVRLPLSVRLDGLLAGLAAAALASIAIEPIADAASGQLAQVAVNLAYPIADTLLVAVTVAVLALLGWGADKGLWTMAGGLTLFAVSDSGYFLRVIAGSYHQGTLLDAGWPIGVFLVAVSLSKPLEGGTAPAKRDDRAVLAVPALVSVTMVAVLVAGGTWHLAPYTVGLAAAAMAAVMARTVMTFREVVTLHEARRREARTDDLTGLANRRRLYERIDADLAVRPADTEHALLLLDVDRFKEINDALGHGIGDELLSQLGDRLAAALRREDLVARLGGDEFAIWLGAGSSEVAGASMATMIEQELRRPFALDGTSIHVSVSIGVAMCPMHTVERSELIRCADSALYQAKRTRCGWSLFNDEGEENHRDRLLLIEELRAALGSPQLACHYQPKIDLRSGAVRGVEALSRWYHPTRGLVMPKSFVPLAERAGLIGALTAQALDAALGQAARWRHAGMSIPVAVNLSMTNLLDVRFVDLVVDLLEQHRVPPELLECEITENVLITESENVASSAKALRSLGVRISIDDYGSGYSSLSYLRSFAADELKLDSSLVTGVAANPQNRAILAASIEVAHSLGLEVVAEGLESAEDVAVLGELGCDVGQGFYLARPASAADTTAWLRRSGAALKGPAR